MKFKILLLAGVGVIALTQAACAQPSPGFPNATIQQPVVKDQCATWVESNQNMLKSAACGAGGGSPGGSSGDIQYNNAGSFGGLSSTGSGAVVRQTSPSLTSPTLVTPALGTPTSGVATNLTGL